MAKNTEMFLSQFLGLEIQNKVLLAGLVLSEDSEGHPVPSLSPRFCWFPAILGTPCAAGGNCVLSWNLKKCTQETHTWGISLINNIEIMYVVIERLWTRMCAKCIHIFFFLSNA